MHLLKKHLNYKLLPCEAKQKIFLAPFALICSAALTKVPAVSIMSSIIITFFLF